MGDGIRWEDTKLLWLVTERLMADVLLKTIFRNGIAIKACQFCIKSSGSAEMRNAGWQWLAEPISLVLNCKNKTCFQGIMTQQSDIKMSWYDSSPCLSSACYV